MAAVQTRIGPLDQGRAMTLEEFREAEEEPGYRYELARGIVEVTEVPNDPHGQIEDNLREAIGVYRRDHPGLIRRCGEADDTVLLTDVMDWARPQALPVTVVPGCGHFFHGQLPLLKALVTRHLQSV